MLFHIPLSMDAPVPLEFISQLADFFPGPDPARCEGVSGAGDQLDQPGGGLEPPAPPLPHRQARNWGARMHFRSLVIHIHFSFIRDVTSYGGHCRHLL
jgi:hypothetical protein